MTERLLLTTKVKEEGDLRTQLCDAYGNTCVTETTLGLPTQKFLTDTGDGLGTLSYIGDYSTVAKDIYYEADSEFRIRTIHANITDDDKVLQETYGSLPSLTNGVKFFIKPSFLGTPIPLVSGYAVHNNYEWSIISSTVDIIAYEDTLKATRTLNISFDLIRDYGVPLVLLPGDQFIVRLNDDFTGLVNHTFHIRGTEF